MNQTTLILAPSLILKNQWLNVLDNNFEHDKLSDKIINPNFITITTYQDFYTNEETILDNIPATFIVLDEAHH